MISLLRSQPPLREAEGALPEPPDLQPDGENSEFEIVMGRRQIASVSLIIVVLLAVFSAISYLAGKSLTPKAAAPAPAPAAVVAAPIAQAPAPPVAPPPQLAPPAQPGPPPAVPDAPVYAAPIQGAVYIQVGAVEKGLAGIWSEGLRTHGLPAFAAPGPNEKIFRVLIGPLPSPSSYQHAKDIVDRIGLTTFGKKYQQ